VPTFLVYGAFIELSHQLQNSNGGPIERHIVLVAPEIDSHEVKRAGLDYWDRVKLTLWDDYGEFESEIAPYKDEVAVFSKKGAAPFWSMPAPDRLFLIFGSETKGLPDNILQRYAHATYHIPITTDTRSLNLSTAAGIALYESLRPAKPFHGWPQDK
jgi:tRNA (cytidine/uridine-2'-O-)-methyltransferase